MVTFEGYFKEGFFVGGIGERDFLGEGLVDVGVHLDFGVHRSGNHV